MIREKLDKHLHRRQHESTRRKEENITAGREPKRTPTGEKKKRTKAWNLRWKRINGHKGRQACSSLRQHPSITFWSQQTADQWKRTNFELPEKIKNFDQETLKITNKPNQIYMNYRWPQWTRLCDSGTWIWAVLSPFFWWDLVQISTTSFQWRISWSLTQPLLQLT